MPQYQRQKQGQARVRILPKDATRAYLLLMKQTGGKMQVLPGDVYVVEDKFLPVLTENQIAFEMLEQKSATSPAALLHEGQPDQVDATDTVAQQKPAHRRHLL